MCLIILASTVVVAIILCYAVAYIKLFAVSFQVLPFTHLMLLTLLFLEDVMSVTMIRSVDKARAAFAAASSITQRTDGKFYTDKGAVVIYATGRKLDSELTFMGKVRGADNQVIGDCYIFKGGAA